MLGFPNPVLHSLFKSEKIILKKPLPLQSNAEMKCSFAVRSCELAPPVLAKLTKQASTF